MQTVASEETLFESFSNQTESRQNLNSLFWLTRQTDNKTELTYQTEYLNNLQ